MNLGENYGKLNLIFSVEPWNFKPLFVLTTNRNFLFQNSILKRIYYPTQSIVNQNPSQPFDYGKDF